jgi:hypothetical protein
MRGLFCNIQAKVFGTYPADKITTVRYTAVSGFLFLRFFVPAILTPKMFGLVDGNCEHSTLEYSIFYLAHSLLILE